MIGHKILTKKPMYDHKFSYCYAEEGIEVATLNIRYIMPYIYCNCRKRGRKGDFGNVQLVGFKLCVHMS